MVNGLMTFWHFGGVTQRVISLADESVHMARRVDDPATVAFALVQRAAALRSTDHLARRRADLRAVIDAPIDLAPGGATLIPTGMAIHIGDYYLAVAKSKEAVEAYERALSAFPNDMNALTGLKRAYEQGKLPDKAKETEKKIEELRAQ